MKLSQLVTAEGGRKSQLRNQKEFMRHQSDRLISAPTLCVAKEAVVCCWRPLSVEKRSNHFFLVGKADDLATHLNTEFIVRQTKMKILISPHSVCVTLAKLI